MDIIAAYREAGTYRGAAEIAGTTHKTVRRVVARQEAGGGAPPRAPRGRNYDGVAGLVAERVEKTQGRISAKRLLPAARAAGYAGSDRNFRRLVAEAKQAWRREHRRGRRPAVWSPGEHLVVDWGSDGGLHVFCAVLAWCRFRFVRFARDPHRDRAMVAFYVSTGARASELLSVTQGGADPGRQLITVTRKGSGELQELPASTDAFVWLRLYQLEMEGLIPKGRRQPLWWTLRRPARPLTYHAVHRMFERAGEAAGSSATLHALRHTAAYRMAEDPQLPLTDVQLVLGHAQLTTTQIYLTPRKE
jgi:integrase